MLHCPHRNANPFWQFVTFERSHDDLSREQLFKDSGAIADIYHHEIRGARHELDLHLGKLLLQISAPGMDDALGFALVRVVRQSRERTGLSDGINVKWLPRLVKHVDQVSPRDSVADAQTGEAVNFGEGAQNNDVPAVADVLQYVGRIIDEFKISFVENDNNVFRDARYETVDRRLRNQTTSGIIGVGDENEAGFRRDRIEHRFEVLLVIRAWRFHRARAEKGRDQFVGDESVLRRDHVIAPMKERMAKKFDHFIRTIGKNDVFARDSEVACECVPQVKPAAVGI